MKLKQLGASLLVGSFWLSSAAYGMSSPPSVQSPTELANAQGVQASSSSDAVNGLAQGCYAIQSAEHGTYLKKYYKGGAIDNGLGYRFEVVTQQDATHFFMKPTSMSHFLLTDKDGRYFASHLPAEISAGRYAGEFAEWEISAVDNGQGEYNFKLKGTALNMDVRHHFTDKHMYFFDLLNPFNLNSEDSFRLIAQNDCTAFPEVTTNVRHRVSRSHHQREWRCECIKRRCQSGGTWIH